jgi:non-heme chloroperoxidase
VEDNYERKEMNHSSSGLKLLAAGLFLSLAVVLSAQTKSDSFKTSDGVRIHYLEAGSGKSIVLIPGWTMPAWIWEKQIDGLSKKYHVIAVDPRSQGESDKPGYGHTPEIRSRDYKELVDHLNLKSPLLVGWSLACGELVTYARQFGTDNVSGLVLVDGLVSDKPTPGMFDGMSGWMNQIQQDRQKQTDGFVRSMYKKPQSEEYLKRVTDASSQVPADTAVVLIYNTLAVKDFSGFDKINKPVLFVYEPGLQQTADFLKTKLGDKIRLEKFEDAGHALFVDDADRFNHVVDEFAQNVWK